MNEQDFVIWTNKHKAVILDKYTGTDSVVTIPNNVHIINKNAFRGLDFIEEVIIPYKVCCIFECAFAECKNLKRIKIDNHEIKFYKTPFLNSADNFEIIFRGTKARFEENASSVFISSQLFSSGDYHHPTATHFEYYKIVTYTHIFSSDEYKPFTCTVKCADGDLVYHERPYETREIKTT